MTKGITNTLGLSATTLGFFLAAVLIMTCFSLAGQEDSLQVSDPNNPTIVPTDTLSFTNVEEVPDSTESVDAINSSIFYDAEDSMIFDAINNRVLLYGGAIVKFETLTLTADYVEYDFTNNEACASGVPDSTGVLMGKPVLDDAGQSFTQEYMCYNFRTQQGYSKIAVTQEGDAVFHTNTSKLHENEWIHVKGGKFTTCDAENPHYHFHLSKAILIPDEKVVSGPLYMKVRKVPLPLALPFAWFPTKNESSHGVILPGYGNANSLGYFLKDGGYYLPLGRNLDTRLLGDIYSRGSWSIKNLTNYRKRYRYTGSFNISRTVVKQSIPELSDFSKSTEFFVRWQHNQDPKARPNSRFTANINFGTTNNFRNNLNSSQTDYLSNTFSSSVQWNKSFPGKPYSLAVNARHSQNSQTGNVQLTLPGITFNRNRTNLPISKWLGSKVSSNKWYDQIGVTYSANFENFISESQSLFRWDETAQLNRQAQNGIRQTASVSTQARLGFVTFTPSFNYNEYWTFKYLDLVEQNSGDLAADTLNGFRSARDWRVSGSLNTRFYGIKNFRKFKNLKAIRHVVTPQAGLSYVPAVNRNLFYYDTAGDLNSYTTFDAARFRPGSTSEQFNVNFSLANNLEVKVRDKKGKRGATKKQKIIDNYIISGSYNMMADSLNLSNISMRGFTTLWNNISLSANSSHSAYDRDSTGREINTYLSQSQGRLLRLESLTGSVNMNLRSKQRTGTRNTENATEEELEVIERNPGAFVDFNVPWSLNLSYTLNLRRNWNTETQADEDVIAQTVLFRGDFSLFEKWKIGFDSGYDFTEKDFTPTTLNLYWDLHCWEFTFNWIPFGVRQSFSIQLNVKSSLLQDLKLQARGGPNGLLF